MARTWLAWLIVLVVWPIGRAQADELEDQIISARKLLEAGKIADAAKAYDIAVDKARTLGRTDRAISALFERQLLHLKLLQFEQSAQSGKWLLSLIPSETPYDKYLSLVARANILLAEGQITGRDEALNQKYSKLITDLDATRDLAAGNAGLEKSLKHLAGITNANRAVVLEEIGQLQESEKFASAALEILDESEVYWRAKAYRMLGLARLKRNNPELGLRDFRISHQLLEKKGLTEQLSQSLTDLITYETDATKQALHFKQLEGLELPTPSNEDAVRAILAAECALFRSNEPSASHWVKHFEDAKYGEAFPVLERRCKLAKSRAALLASNIDAALQALAEAKAATSPEDLLAIWEILELELRVLSRTGPLQVWEKLQEMQSLLSTWQEKGTALSPELRFQMDYNFGGVFLEMGLIPFALHYARTAMTEANDAKLFRLETEARFLYAQCWIDLDPKGGRFGTKGKPEWKNALEQVRPALAKLSPEQIARFHSLYARGLQSIGDLKAAQAELDQVRTADNTEIGIKRALLQADIASVLNDAKSARGWLDRIAGLKLDSNLEFTRQYLEGTILELNNEPEEAYRKYQDGLSTVGLQSAASESLFVQSLFTDSHAACREGACRIAVSLAAKDPDMHKAAATLVLGGVNLNASIRPQKMTESLDQDLTEFALASLAGELADQKNVPPNIQLPDRSRNSFFRVYSRYVAASGVVKQENDSQRVERLLERLMDRSNRLQRQIRVYQLGRQSGAILVISSDKTYRVHLLSRETVESIRDGVQQWRNAVESSRDSNPAFATASAKLTTRLFPDGLNTLTNVFELVPHEDLWNLSFSALVTKAGSNSTVEYLDAVSHPVILTPVFLSRLSEKQAEESNEREVSDVSKPTGVLFIGPDADDRRQQWSLQDIAAEGDYYSMDLQCIADRLLEIAQGKRIWEQVQSTDPRKASFNLVQYKAERDFHKDDKISQADWIHITAHGIRENPWEPHIGIVLLARTRLGLEGNVRNGAVHYTSDGVLTPREIDARTLRCQFVFLHGCSTAKGFVSSSGGSLGLVSSFLTAGAKRVFASHWVVPMDNDLGDQIAEFYKRLIQDRHSASASLIELREQLRKKGSPVKVWAAFSEFN